MVTVMNPWIPLFDARFQIHEKKNAIHVCLGGTKCIFILLCLDLHESEVFMDLIELGSPAALIKMMGPFVFVCVLVWVGARYMLLTLIIKQSDMGVYNQICDKRFEDLNI